MTRSLLLLLGLVAPLACAPLAHAQVVSAIYVPDSINDRVLSLDPATGAVVNPALIQDARLGTAVQAIQGFNRDGILVSDQTADVVWQYTSAGAFVGVFAPAGGPNIAVLDNIRGIALSRDGERLLVTVSSGPNANAVVAFDRAGAVVATPVAAGAGGLLSPWDVFERAADVLVGGSGNGSVLRYGLDGTPLGTFAGGLSFPQQIADSRAGGVLVANFSPLAERGIYEYDASGALLGRTTIVDPLLGAPRGVYDLASGNLLVATSAGVYEVTRAGALVSTKVSGGQYRYLSPAFARATAAADAPEAAALRISAPRPTPAAGRATLTVDVPAAQTLRVTVADALGRTVATLHDGPAPAGPLVLTADVSALAPGVYVVRVAGAGASPGASAQTRLVVVR